MSQEYISSLFARAKRIWRLLPRSSKEKLVYIDAKVYVLEDEHNNLWTAYNKLLSVLKNKDDEIKTLVDENAKLKGILETEDPSVIH